MSEERTNAHLLTEDICTLKEVCHMLPTRPHFATVFRWKERGIQGVKLETYKIGSRVITSRQAVHRFLQATQR